MSLPETLADTDVAGDGSYDGLTFAFDDDGPMEGAMVFGIYRNVSLLSNYQQFLSTHQHRNFFT
jgi:hypothetical protein